MLSLSYLYVISTQTSSIYIVLLVKLHPICIVAGNTDEIQVADAGFGRLIKHYANEAASETQWLDDDGNLMGIGINGHRRMI